MKQMIAVVILLQAVILLFMKYYYTVLHNMIRGLYEGEDNELERRGL